MSENTSQGQQYGNTNQGGPSQPQSQGFEQLGTSEQRGASQHESPDVATRERGQMPWQGQAREQSNYQPSQQQQDDKRHEYERTARGEQPRGTDGEYVRADEVDRLIQERLAERDRKHAQETAKLRANVPQLVVAQHGGGPGNDNHRPSWNLAEQEAAARGEDLPHWHDDEE